MLYADVELWQHTPGAVIMGGTTQRHGPTLLQAKHNASARAKTNHSKRLTTKRGQTPRRGGTVPCSISMQAWHEDACATIWNAGEQAANELGWYELDV
eukprot:1160775-Pelagomonas_calceolata.AAC.1